MSDTVRYKGKLIKENRLANETLEEHCKRVLGNQELHKSCDSYEEMLREKYYVVKELGDFIILGEDIFKVEAQKQNACYDFFEGTLNEDGSIDFHVMYYNGGCCLDEALEEVYKSLK